MAALFASSLVLGCSESSENAHPKTPEEDPKITVLATFTVLQDITQNVAGDHAEVISLIKQGAEIHGYEPTPGDIQRAKEADLIVENGLGLEIWLNKFTADIDVPTATLSQGIEPINIASDAYKGKPNPHAWMSPAHAETYAYNAAHALSRIDPNNSAAYQRNARDYATRIRAAGEHAVQQLQQRTTPITHLVTCEGAFSYLAHDLGMHEHYLWPVNAERQSTPKQVAAAITAVRDNNIEAVFCESTVSPSSMYVVADESGATFGGTLYVDSLSSTDGPVPTFLSLMKHNLATITQAGKNT